MALPTEQEIINLKNTVQQLQNAQADKWLHDILLVLIGAIAGAIPTIAIALISNRWSKRLFYMTRDKEEHVLKSKLFGEIRIAEGKLLLSSSDTLAALIMQTWYLLRSSKAPQHNKSSEIKELDKHQTASNIETKKWIQDKAEFIRVVSEYNYFLKDKKLDELLTKMDEAPLVGQLKMSDYSYEQLISDETVFLIFQTKMNDFNTYEAKLKAIIQHILSTAPKQ